jgi:hypothetical protein
MRFVHVLLVLPVTLLAAFASSAAIAADTSTAPVAVSVPEAVPAATGLNRAALSPMMQEILEAWDAHAAAIAVLEQRIEATTDATDAIALQQEIESLRRQVEIQILGIQAHHARLAGRLEQAAEIEAAIEAMTAPPPEAIPVERRPDDGRDE